jgi:hypothetical protein
LWIWLDPPPLVGVHLSGRRHTQPCSLLSKRHSISVPIAACTAGERGVD